MRDALSAPGARPGDVDIEVHGDVDGAALESELSAVGRTDRTGAHFEILRVVVGGESFDVSFTSLAESEAFARRDFTINAMGWDPVAGELIDPFGGAADLRDGMLRHTSDQFADDPARVLRAMQLAARFNLRLDAATARLARAIRPSFDSLPVERVWLEWRKLARSGVDISAGMRVLEATGWLACFPELADTRGCEQDPSWHPEGDVFTHLGLAADECARVAVEEGWDELRRERVVLATLLHDLGKPQTTVREADGRITSRGHAQVGADVARAFLRRIGAPHPLIADVATLVAEHMTATTVPGRPSRHAVRRLGRRLGRVSIDDWAAVVDADCAGRGAGSRPSPAHEWLSIWRADDRAGSVPLLTGRDLIDHGMAPGPDFKAVLAAALDAQDAGEFVDRHGALGWLRARRGR